MYSLKYDPTLSYSDFQRLMWALSRVETAPTSGWQKEFVQVWKCEPPSSRAMAHIPLFPTDPLKKWCFIPGIHP